MTPLPAEQVQQASQVLLAFLDSDGASVPGNMIEGVVSGKSLLRGILSGALVVCQTAPAAPPAPAAPKLDPDLEAKPKKVAKKVIKKAA
jgi:hypothetical protein